ncbi:FAD-binding oxidoreductase [Nonomuraea soli]
MFGAVSVRDAGPDDDVAGVRPRWVVLPESVEEISEVLRVCTERGLAVVPVGGGTKLHWARRPDRCDVLLDLCCMNQVLEHAAGDLVVRVEAGVTMDALAAVLAGKGQELALDTPLEGATVGGTLATALAGPRSLRYGTARDLLIGVTVVLADGTVARSGGKVVKNVAGYDLGKLLTGSYGTLGVIAEATFRLHPLPSKRFWASGRVPAAREDRDDTGSTIWLPGDLDRLLHTLVTSHAEPSAIELDWPSGASEMTVSALFEGGAAEGRARAVQDLGLTDVADAPPATWARLPGDEVLIEARAPLSRVQALAVAVLGARDDAGVPAATRMWLGDHLVARIALPPDTGPAAVAAFVTTLRAGFDDDEGRIVLLAAPHEAARRVERWGRVGALQLMRRVKERFDPGGLLAPGRLPGGV